jgi:glycosyltransferase involved in cell wall biosynthesis
MPFFSIIIPTYNRVRVLSRSIDSVLSQTYKDFELIIVDNGSTDNTQKWLSDNYQDSRIFYHYQAGSGSPANPRNIGISLSKGEWVCFLDSDDKWNQEKLQSVYEEIQLDTDLSVVCHNESIYSEASNSVGEMLKYGPNSHDMYKKMLVFGNRLSTSATSVRTKFLRDNNLQFNELEKYATVEDYDLWLNLARRKAKFKFIPRSLGFYTLGYENMIFSSGVYCTNLEALLKQHVYSIQKFEKNKKNLWGVIQIRISICQIKHGEFTSFLKMFYMIMVFLQHPFYFLVFLNGYIKKSFNYFE